MGPAVNDSALDAGVYVFNTNPVEVATDDTCPGVSVPTNSVDADASNAAVVDTVAKLTESTLQPGQITVNLHNPHTHGNSVNQAQAH